MPSSRALFLKGILGVAGLGVSSAGGIGLGLGKTFTEGQKEQAAADIGDEHVNDPQGLKIEVDKDADLGFPEGCDTSCSLTSEQLKNLKFEQKGDAAIEFKGLKDGDEFELTIEKSEDQTNYPKGKKYILKPKTISEQVTIKNIKEVDIVFESGKEVLIREISSGGKLEHLLEEVTELGIPKRCFGDQATTECELTQLQLQKLEFEIRDGEAKTVEGLDEGNIVTLKVENKSSDKDNYPHGKKYTLTSNRYVLMGGVKGEDILLEKGKEFVIREKKEGGKLELLLDEVDRLGIPRRCEADEVSPKTCPLIQKQLKDLKFEPKEGTQITVEGWNDNSKFELEIEDKSDDLTNYPKGRKYTLKAKTGTAKIRGIKDGDIDIWDGKEVVIRETSEGGKLEKAPEEVDDLGIPKECKRSCPLTAQQLKNLKFEKGGEEEITVQPENSKLELRIEERSDRDNYPQGKKYILGARKTSGTVTIKGIKGGDIVLKNNQVVVIREKQGERKLEKAPEEINDLGIPSGCNSGLTCHLTREQLQRIKFEPKSGSSISIQGLNEGNTVNLRVETQSNVSDYPRGKKYTLTSTSGQVTIAGAKDKDIVLEENKSVVFRVTKDGKKLETYLDVLGIPRPWGAEEIKEGSDPGTYHLSSDQLKDLKFKAFDEATGDVTVTGLNVREKIKLTISWDKDKGKYPDNRKFSFDNISKNEDIKIIKGGQSGQTLTIAKKKASWFKNVDGQLEFVDAKDKDQIAREEKIKEKNEILKELGLGNLKIGNFIGDARNPTKHEQTNVEFRNEGDLKKIQFKEFGGGANGVTGLSGRNIKVYLEWDGNENRFPKNMKFSFENQNFDMGYNFWKGTKTISITQKKINIPMPTFKIEKQNNKWYLAKAS